MNARRRALRWLAATAAALALPGGTGEGTAAAQGAATDAPVIAAAANLRFALPRIAARFEAETGQAVRLSFGSSGNLTRQIRQGAPYQMFLAADEAYVHALARAGLTRGEGSLYAVGRLALFVPAGSPLAPDGSLDDLAGALEAGRVRRFAIANPEHAPYGDRAAEALSHRGLWDRIRPLLVLGENVSQAAQFAASGNAEGGIIPRSLALAPNVAARGAHALIPEDWHAPLRQRMVLLKGAGAVAEAFHDYVGSPAARAILDRHGYVLGGGPG